MLFAIDFDDTIASKHTHNKIAGVIKQENKELGHSPTKNDPEKQWEIVKDIAPLGEKDAWKKNLIAMVEQGHTVSIVSFNAYGSIIPRYLEEVIGLPKEIVDKIEVVAFMPDKPPTNNLDIGPIEQKNADKNNHIALAKQRTGFKGSDAEVMLIDDSPKNVDAAANHHYGTLLATEDGSHLNEIETVLKNLQVEEKQLPQEKEQQTMAMALTFPDEKTENDFIHDLETSAAENHMIVEQDENNILFSDVHYNGHHQSEPHPLFVYNPARQEIKMIKSDNSIGDYTKVIGMTIKAIAKSIFGKIKDFFSPNKYEKRKLESARAETDYLKNSSNAVNAVIQAERRMKNMTIYEQWQTMKINENYSRYNENISHHKKTSYSTSQQYAMSLEKKMSTSFKQKAEDAFNNNVPPSLYKKLSPFKNEWKSALSPPIPPNTPNLGAILSIQYMTNNMQNQSYKQKLDAHIKTAVKEEGKDFQHRPENLSAEEKYQNTMRELKESAIKKTDKLVADSTSGFNQNIYHMNIKTNDQEKLKSEARDCVFADSKEKMNAHITDSESIFVQNSEAVEKYENNIKKGNYLSPVENQYYMNEKQTLRNQENLFNKYSNSLSNIQNDYQTKAQIAKDICEFEKKAQEKYPSKNSSALYDEVTVLSNKLEKMNGVNAEDKFKPLFKIENEFQSKLEKLEEKLSKEGYTEKCPKEWYKDQYEEIYENRDSQLNHLRIQTEQKINDLQMKNELAKKEEEKFDSVSSGPQQSR